MGYRAEEWTKAQIQKNFALPIRADFRFRLVQKEPTVFETTVSTTLPIYLKDASDPRPDQRDKLTVLVGATKRLAAQVGLVDFKMMRKILRYARKYIYPQFETFSIDEIQTTEEWINNVNQTESRKQELRQALDELRTEGLWRFNDEHLIVDSFVKDEAYDDLKAPRWINASPDVIKVAWGPLIDKMMEKLVKHRAMIKTVPVSERAKAIWQNVGGFGVIAQSSDATAMEDHYANFYVEIAGRKIPTDPRYRIVNDFMMFLLGGVKITDEIRRATKFLFFKHATDQKIEMAKTSHMWDRIEDSKGLKVFLDSVIDKYRLLKMRNFGTVLINAILCSGEMNTSFKNTFTMFVMVNYAQYEISGGNFKTCESLNEGDDALAVYAGGVGPDEAWWARHGWVVKVEFRGQANFASFCGLVFDPEPLVSVPDLRKVLKRFGWTSRRYVSSSYACRMSLLRAKALSMACEYGNVPILGPLAHRILNLTRHVNVRKSVLVGLDMYEREQMSKALASKVWMLKPNIHERTRDLVWTLQGISPDVQLDIEMQINLRVNLNCCFEIPEIDFGFVGVANMLRCHETMKVEKNIDVRGRQRLCDALLGAFELSWAHGNWGTRVTNQMRNQIALLREAKL